MSPAYRLWTWRDQLRAWGYAISGPRYGYWTEEECRAMRDAILAERPALDAIASRWDPRR